MEFEYEFECPVCDTAMTLVVKDCEEPPTHCPMCGSPNDEHWEDL